MDEITSVKAPAKRRRFSKAFKARIVAACDQPDASVAGVALANGLNTNLVHRWRRLAKAKALSRPVQPGFLPVPLGSSTTDSTTAVVIEVNGIKIHWPLLQIDSAIPWLRRLGS